LTPTAAWLRCGGLLRTDER